jgi:hypothetical protein
MRSTRRGGRSWRPGPDTAIALVALVLAAAGVSWATVGESGQPVITACANEDLLLSLSTNGSCPQGSTTVQWNQQGPQGPQGPQGSPGLIGPQGPPGAGATPAAPVVATLFKTYKSGFSVQTAFDAPGAYTVNGNVTENVDPSAWPARFTGTPPSIALHCELLAGPNGGQTTLVGRQTQVFSWYGGTIRHYFPSTYDGPAGAGGTVTITSVPYTAFFTCETFGDSSGDHHRQALPGVQFVNPTINIGHETLQTLSPSKLIEAGPIGPR